MKKKSKLPEPLAQIDPAYRERFVSFAEADAVRVYRWLEDEELKVRLSTRLAFSTALDLWQQSVRLRINHMLPGTLIDLPNEVPRDVAFWSRRWSKEWRLHLLGLSISTSKSIVDLILGGHYTEAFALQRSAAERWKFCLYARIRPDDVFRWMPPHWLDPFEELDDIPRDQSIQLEKSDWKIVEDRIKGQPDEVLLTLINKLMKQLNHHVHPSMEGLSQIFAKSDRWRPAVSPQYSETHARFALRNTLILEECFLLETIMLGKNKAIPRRKILKFANGPLYRELKRFFEMDRADLADEEPLEPVQLPDADD